MTTATALKPAMTVLFFKTRTTMQELCKFGETANDITRDAVLNNMIVCGPLYWYYSGCSEDPNAEFDFEIQLPVSPMGNKSSKYEIKQTPEYKCLTYMHQGPWSDLPKVYEELVPNLFGQGLKMKTSAREAYINCDFENHQNCLTEIQIEIE